MLDFLNKFEVARYSNMDPLNKYSYMKDGTST